MANLVTPHFIRSSFVIVANSSMRSGFILVTNLSSHDFAIPHPCKIDKIFVRVNPFLLVVSFLTLTFHDDVALLSHLLRKSIRKI